MTQNFEINEAKNAEIISSHHKHSKTPVTKIDLNRISFEEDQKLRTKLRKQLLQAGCFKSAPVKHCLHMFGVVTLYAGGFTLFLLQPTVGIYLITLVVLAFANVQAGFIAHEAGHGAITKRRWLAKLIGQLFDSFLAALSYSHYQSIHKPHHSHCNEQAVDVDMQSDLFSVYPDSVLEKRTWIGRFITRYQAYLIWPLISLQGFTLKIDSLNTIRKNPKTTRLDQIAMGSHMLLWFGLPVYVLGLPHALLNYVLMTWFIGFYCGYTFLVNHVGTRVIGPEENIRSFTQRVAVTRNLGDSRFNDIFFGGINNHIEHHLFPTISSFKLRQARVITRKFCKQHSVPYREMGWFRAAGEVFGYLNHLAREGRVSRVNL